MLIGDRLRVIREDKKLSQADVELRTGLLRCYVSRVENGHTVPALETLEKFARALETPLYALFYESEPPAVNPAPVKRNGSRNVAWGAVGKDARFLRRLTACLAKMRLSDREALFLFTQKLVAGKHSKGDKISG